MDLRLKGLQSITQFLNSNGIATEYYLDCDMQHGLELGGGANGFFGIGSNNTDDALIYIVQRTATFFQAIMNNKANNIQRRVFYDCPNNRHGCAGTITNDDSCDGIGPCPH